MKIPNVSKQLDGEIEKENREADFKRKKKEEEDKEEEEEE